MYGEVEGDAPHEDQSELEPLHLPGDGAAAPRGCPVLKQQNISRQPAPVLSLDKAVSLSLSLDLIMFYNGELFKL